MAQIFCIQTEIFFAQCPRLNKKHKFFFKMINIFENFCCKLMNAVFKNVREKSLLVAKVFCSMCNNIIKLFFKPTQPKCSYGHTQYVFDKFFKSFPSFPSVNRNMFGQPPKKILRTFASPKYSFGHTKCSFKILFEKKLGKGPNLFRSMSKSDEKKFW